MKYKTDKIRKKLEDAYEKLENFKILKIMKFY